MINCIFTIDYEIYGNGSGTLKELIYEPAKKLKEILDRAGAKIVVFVETTELEKINDFKADPAIQDVQNQILDLYKQGHEIALHLHPQWCNSRFSSGKWELDYREYNMCGLPEERICEIVDESINYLRTVLSDKHFTPFSFRAGNWLFQPTLRAAKVLSGHGIKIDSSVFKGGLQHLHKLDYRKASRNGFFWKFKDDVNSPDSSGTLLEIPIYTQMVPFWKMVTTKRVGLQHKSSSSGARAGNQKLYRLWDMARFFQPLKLDFCRMTLKELISMVEAVVKEDLKNPSIYRPMVLIGHTKDLVDFETVDLFLQYLKQKKIAITTLKDAYNRCVS